MRRLTVFTIIILCLAFSGMSAIAQTDAAGAYEGLHVEEFSADHYLKGLHSSVTEYFYTGRWSIEGARLVLSISTSQLLRGASSDITVYLNDLPVYSGALPETNGEIAELPVELPAEKVKLRLANSITVSAYLRANENEPCVDYTTSANWVNIFRESRVEVAYKTLFEPDSIAALYAQLSSIDALECEQTGIYVSGSSEGVLTAAAWASAGLAQNSVMKYTNIRSCGGALPVKPYSLYISDTDALHPSIKSKLDEVQLADAENGAIAVVIEYADSDVLLITGKNPTALANAGRMLANSKYMAQLGTKYAVISENNDFCMEKYRFEQYTELTAAGEYVKGSFRRSTSFYIDWPADRFVASSSELSLDIRYSKNIDFERSLVTVYANGIPMGSSKLTPVGADGMNLLVPFPKDAQLTGRFTIEVAFDLEALDDWCRLSPEEMPWGYIAPTSMLKLDGVDISRLLFDDYPSPFVRDGSVNALAFVLPDEPGDADIAALHSVSAGLGCFLKDNCGELRAMTAKDAAALAGCNVIYIGSAKRNAGLGSLAWTLDFSGTQLESSSEKLKIDPGYGTSLGVGEMIVDPENGQYSIMLLSGSTDSELMLAAKQLEDTEMLWKLSGDAFIVSNGDDEVSCYTFLQQDKPLPKNESTPESTRSAVNVLLAAGLALTLCAAALIMLWIRAGRGRK